MSPYIVQKKRTRARPQLAENEISESTVVSQTTKCKEGEVGLECSYIDEEHILITRLDRERPGFGDNNICLVGVVI